MPGRNPHWAVTDPMLIAPLVELTWADPSERQQMTAMLKKFESEQSASAAADDDEDAEDDRDTLLDRLQGLDLDDEAQTEQVLAALTESERKQFANREYLASLLVQWNPWWPDNNTTSWAAKSEPTKPFVEVVGGDGGAAAEGVGDTDQLDAVALLEEEESVSPSAGAARRERAEPPPLAEGVPPLAELLRGKQPAKELIFNILDLVYCYAYTCRRYNGDVDESWSECAEGLLAISPVLGADAAHGSVEVALVTTVAQVQDVEAMFVSSWASARVMADVAAIIRDPTDASRALSHLYTIVARTNGSKAPVLMPQAREARQRLKRAEKKLLFFVSWWTWLSSDDGDGGEVATRLLAAARTEIEAVHAKRIAELSAVEADRLAYERAWNGPTPPRSGRPLIQEL